MKVGLLHMIICTLCYFLGTEGLSAIRNVFSNPLSSLTDGVNCSIDPSINRRRLVSLIAPIFPTFFVPSSSSATDVSSKVCSLSKSLLEARSQLDLAVQASSVQAWSDALDAANDKALDASSLKLNFDLCNKKTQDDPPKKQQREDALMAVSKLREELSKSELSTANVMSVMRYGTSARTAIDSYFEL